MSEAPDQLERLAAHAIESAASELGIRPLDLARGLDSAGIARLLQLLNAALRHVENPGLRRRIEDTLLTITDGRMPGQTPESELDWALKVAKDRRVVDPDESGA